MTQLAVIPFVIAFVAAVFGFIAVQMCMGLKLFTRKCPNCDHRLIEHSDDWESRGCEKDWEGRADDGEGWIKRTDINCFCNWSKSKIKLNLPLAEQRRRTRTRLRR